MEYKKTIILLVLVVFLLSITCVSASEIDDTLASEDTNTIGLSVDKDIIEDNLQTSEENEALASTDYDEAIAQTDTEVLGADSATYFDLAQEIGQPGNINLIHKNYTYDGGEPITISEANKVIDGNGAVIDMNRSTIRAFYISASGVTIKNLTIKNANYNGNGGAIYFESTGTVTNCNFINNKATGTASWGGAIFFVDTGTVTNCNFTDNIANRYGGAVYFNGNGEVTNCNFVNNKATTDNSNGGAVCMYSGSVENCNFTDNSAYRGGAVYLSSTGTVANCNFTCNTATYYGSAVYFNGGGNVSNCNFTNNSARNSAVYFLNNGDVTNCNFINNKATGTASGDGGAVRMSSGTVLNCNFTDNSARDGGAVRMSSGTVLNCNFTDNIANRYGGAVYFDETGTVSNCNFTNNSAQNGGVVYFVNNGTVTNCNFTGNNASRDGGAVRMSSGTVLNCNFTGNTASGDGGAVRMSSGTVLNCNFTDNIANRYGGAVYLSSTGNVSNCNFTNNKATGDYARGGAIFFVNNGTVTNCNFTGNNAKNGGAILSSTMCYAIVVGCVFTGNSAFNGGAVNLYSGSIEYCDFISNSATNAGGAAGFSEEGRLAYCNFEANTASKGGAVSMFTGNVENCSFTGNNATMGSAINCNGFSDTNISNSCFLNNRANASADDSFNVTVNGNTLEIAFMGQNNLLNAIYSNGNINFTNVTYWGFNGIAKTGDDSIVMSPSNCEAGQNISIAGVVNGNILKTTKLTNENGKVILENSIDYYLVLRHDGDSYYTEAEKTISNMKFNVNVTSQTTTNRTVNITAKSNILNETMPGKLLFMVTTGENITANYAGNGTWWAVYEFADYGDYQVNATYVGLDNVTINNGTISISKIPTEIIINTASLDLFVGDEIVIVANLTPADAGNVTFTSSNESVVEVDAQGNVIAQGKGQAIITVSFAGNNKYAAAENRTINVTVSLNDASVTVDNNTLNLKAGEAYAINATKHPDTIMLDITYTSSNSSVVTVDKKGIVTAVGVGTAVITVEVGDDEIYAKNSTNVTVTVSKASTEIGAKPVTATYNINKNLVITLKDANGNPVTGVSLSVDLNGAKKYTTDKNGQVKVSTKGLDPKTYTAKITFNGNANYVKSAKNVKVTVKKAKPKIIAKKKKTYRAKAKTKKLKITLKDNTGKPIKNAKVRLMLKKIGKGSKKKTKSKANKKIAKTNKKGKATFKVKKNKKAKYLAYVKFYANKHYKKTVKKIKITIK